MIVAYHAIREALKREPKLGDLRAAAFRTAIDKIARSYPELGCFRNRIATDVGRPFRAGEFG